MGLLVGTTLYPVVSTSKRHKSIMWAFRLAAIPLAIVLFVVLIRNFYTSDPYAGMSVWTDTMIIWNFNVTIHSMFRLSVPILYTNFFE